MTSTPTTILIVATKLLLLQHSPFAAARTVHSMEPSTISVQIFSVSALTNPLVVDYAGGGEIQTTTTIRC